MRRYYYWADQLPTNHDYSQPAETFFKNLLSVNDRFSWISNGQDIAAPSNAYFMYGFHYALVEVAGYNGSVGVVNLVNNDGAADRAGWHFRLGQDRKGGVYSTGTTISGTGKWLNVREP